MNLARKLVSAVFSPIPVSRDRALGISERLVAATTLTSSLEYLSQRRHLEKGGLNDWEIMREEEAVDNPMFRCVLDLVGDRRVTVGLHVTRAAVSIAMMLPGNSRWRGAGNLALSGITAILYPRHRFGTDGSDQVSLLVQSATGAARLSSSPQTQDALLWYVAIQANLSYAASGWVKLLGDKWRSGEALPGVMRTKTYGFEKVYRFSKQHPRASTMIQHGVLAMECLFPLVYVAGGRFARPFLASAASFHVANGFVMGLGRFMTAFPSMHPFVAYTSTPRSHPVVAGRDDRMVPAALVALGVSAAVAGTVAVQKRLKTLQGWGTSRRITTRHGNELQFESGGTPDGESPIVIFVAGLAATAEHFAWISEKIVTETDCGLIVYARAGYAGSRRRSRADYTLQESVDDLLDLCHAVTAPSGRKVALVGHSLGGEIIRRAASEMDPETLEALVYLDPSHPAELQRSEAQDLGARNLHGALTTATWALRLGTGILMSRPRWLDSLPPAYRDKVFAQYSDARLWSAASREWRAVEKDFRSHSADVDPIAACGVVVAAQNTVDQDAEQLAMYEELVRTHDDPSSELRVIPGTDHDSMLTNARHAHLVADVIIAHLQRSRHVDLMEPSADSDVDLARTDGHDTRKVEVLG
ncbi:alpha/beta fold hydrolase [Nesterenkonia sp. HG001]|uniref:alpha/beta fold hydrolase n=1 Tax=Nesterenkonia sp. HG001 TaxID=2983207 RepID=UPI002AC5B6CF|nr:alpha/beta fold hydrolase [Nesterenkonia sp. HG001]MDZ5077366.1 alpha/beta fold hydrolase [Nesterenkonia sp. HG001]